MASMRPRTLDAVAAFVVQIGAKHMVHEVSVDLTNRHVAEYRLGIGSNGGSPLSSVLEIF